MRNKQFYGLKAKNFFDYQVTHFGIITLTPSMCGAIQGIIDHQTILACRMTRPAPFSVNVHSLKINRASLTQRVFLSGLISC